MHFVIGGFREDDTILQFLAGKEDLNNRNVYEKMSKFSYSFFFLSKTDTHEIKVFIPSAFSEGTKRVAISIFIDWLNVQDEPQRARRLLGRRRCVALRSVT